MSFVFFHLPISSPCLLRAESIGRISMRCINNTNGANGSRFMDHTTVMDSLFLAKIFNSMRLQIDTVNKHADTSNGITSMRATKQKWRKKPSSNIMKWHNLRDSVDICTHVPACTHSALHKSVYFEVVKTHYINISCAPRWSYCVYSNIVISVRSDFLLCFIEKIYWI